MDIKLNKERKVSIAVLNSNMKSGKIISKYKNIVKDKYIMNN